MDTNAEMMRRKAAATPRGVGVLAEFCIHKAKNAEIWDTEGRRYIDFGAGIAVLNTGHQHPKIIAAIEAQLHRFTHSAYQVVPYESYIALAERINALSPGSHAKKTAFFTTGAEAVENAIKIARAATGRPGVIALSGAFHGRTFMGMALTGKVVPYKVGFGPFPGSIYHIPAPVALHGGSVEKSLDALQSLFKSDIAPEQVAAIIVEPVQGEGGFYVAPPAFLRALRAICDQHGIVLIADEIQTGFARTGKMFAVEHADVVPDLMTIAKSLAGGMPLSGVVGKAEIMDAPAPGGLGGTYAGNPLSIAAAHAVLDVIAEAKLIDRANHLGQRLQAALRAAQATQPHIADVRGLGAMVAVEFMQPAQNGAPAVPDPELAKAVQRHAMAKGLILLTCGVYANVIRFLFPLTIEDAVFEEGLQILSDALKSARS